MGLQRRAQASTMNINEISIGSIIADKGMTFVILDIALTSDGSIRDCIALTADKHLIAYTIHCDNKGVVDDTSYRVMVDNIMSVYGTLRAKLYKKGISKLGDITI